MILVIAEHGNNAINRASWEPIAAAQQIGGPVKVALLGRGISALAAELAQAEVDEVLTVEDDALENYTADGYTQAVSGLVEAEQPALVLLAHTYQARDFAPKVAARLDRALVTDCVEIRSDGGKTTCLRPMFQAKLVAEVVPHGPAPHIITFQIGTHREDAVRRGRSPAPVRQAGVTVDAAAIRQQPEPPFREAKQVVDLSQAERIVSVGRGIKDQEHIALAKSLADALGAELAASRPICDVGWLPMDRQVGSSGQTVAPKLYLALGISGAIQHVVGMKGAKTIAAINKDAEAPIFEIADYGIAGDLFEIVPALLDELKK
jgi:electron transfer flavoprotein alpha subunit